MVRACSWRQGTVRLVAGALMLLACTLMRATHAAAEGDLAEDEVASLVEAWVVGDADPRVREAAWSQLCECDPLLAQKPILRLLASEATRGAALELAAALRVSGLFTTVKPWLAGEHEERVIRVLARSDELAAHEYLLQRLKAAEYGTHSYQLLLDALCTHGLVATSALLQLAPEMRSFGPEPTLEMLEDPAWQAAQDRREDLAVVMAFQVHVPESEWREQPVLFDERTEKALYVVTEWPRLAIQYQRSARRQPVRGTSLMRRIGPGSRGIQRLGPNILVQPGGVLEVGPLPDVVQQGNWRLNAFVRVFTKDGCGVALGLGTGHEWVIETRGGEWVVAEAFGSERFAKVVPGDWTEVGFTWVDESLPGQRYARVCSASAAGTSLMERGKLNGRITYMRFRAGRDHAIVVGSVAYAKTGK